MKHKFKFDIGEKVKHITFPEGIAIIKSRVWDTSSYPEGDEGCAIYFIKNSNDYMEWEIECYLEKIVENKEGKKI
jgi:hypothetical protein